MFEGISKAGAFRFSICFCFLCFGLVVPRAPTSLTFRSTQESRNKQGCDADCRTAAPELKESQPDVIDPHGKLLEEKELLPEIRPSEEIVEKSRENEVELQCSLFQDGQDESMQGEGSSVEATNPSVRAKISSMGFLNPLCELPAPWTRPLVVTISTTLQRIKLVRESLLGILSQTLKPDEVWLHISGFSSGAGLAGLPLSLQQVIATYSQIRVLKENSNSTSALQLALQEAWRRDIKFQAQAALVAVADDAFHHPDVLCLLVKGHLEHPREALGLRGFRFPGVPTVEKGRAHSTICSANKPPDHAIPAVSDAHQGPSTSVHYLYQDSAVLLQPFFLDKSACSQAECTPTAQGLLTDQEDLWMSFHLWRKDIPRRLLHWNVAEHEGCPSLWRQTSEDPMARDVETLESQYAGIDGAWQALKMLMHCDTAGEWGCPQLSGMKKPNHTISDKDPSLLLANDPYRSTMKTPAPPRPGTKNVTKFKMSQLGVPKVLKKSTATRKVKTRNDGTSEVKYTIRSHIKHGNKKRVKQVKQQHRAMIQKLRQMP
ncbi:hypothetical protein CYMTET_21750 [Cymbomonas tetramitiformis]|uniref:Uncharacterized protein n=1 Tax=Cymbomonas tetramitiformis TaxID=36881 RepID=A0AAE0L2N8_9CHLO|nr:hypothetical protein CYMTET_21750 [Cymbomonas tetramitiformis]